MSAVALQAAIAEPFGYPEGEKQAAKWKTHERNDERKPAAVRTGARTRKTAQHSLKQRRSQNARADDAAAPLQ